MQRDDAELAGRRIEQVGQQAPGGFGVVAQMPDDLVVRGAQKAPDQARCVIVVNAQGFRGTRGNLTNCAPATLSEIYLPVFAALQTVHFLDPALVTAGLVQLALRPVMRGAPGTPGTAVRCRPQVRRTRTAETLAARLAVHALDAPRSGSKSGHHP